jgi:hypothetical protein
MTPFHSHDEWAGTIKTLTSHYCPQTLPDGCIGCDMLDKEEFAPSRCFLTIWPPSHGSIGKFGVNKTFQETKRALVNLTCSNSTKLSEVVLYSW